MNRLTAKFVHGLARLAFWRKPVEAIPEQPQSPEPAPAGRVKTTEAAPGATADMPVIRTGWFARLKQVLRRHRDPALESFMDPDPGVGTHPSPEPVGVSAAEDGVSRPKLSLLDRLKTTLRRQPKTQQIEADVVADALKPGTEKGDQATASSDTHPDDGVPQLKLSFLGRLKTTFRRQPKLEQIEVDADANASKPGAETDRKTSGPSDARPDDEADAVQISRMRRVGAMLSNKWVWIPSVSIVLLAIMIAMLLMLLQSAQEKKQLQTKLIATQKKLEQTSIPKQTAARKNAPGHADDPTHETLGSAADTQPGADVGDCVVTDKASVSQNLKNCIDSFNNDSAR